MPYLTKIDLTKAYNENKNKRIKIIVNHTYTYFNKNNINNKTVYIKLNLVI